ncbi:hypothetical protein BCAR13_870029 [Paraburkholderia caribensis]|nr:hypothetical protein BCAR13_870029 [Paraburkholderia caribensis]
MATPGRFRIQPDHDAFYNGWICDDQVQDETQPSDPLKARPVAPTSRARPEGVSHRTACCSYRKHQSSNRS